MTEPPKDTEAIDVEPEFLEDFEGTEAEPEFLEDFEEAEPEFLEEVQEAKPVVEYEEALKHGSVSWGHVCGALMGWLDADGYEDQEQYFQYYQELSEAFYDRRGGPDDSYISEAFHAFLVKTTRGELHLIINPDEFEVEAKHEEPFVRANDVINRALGLDRNAALLMGTAGRDSPGLANRLAWRRREAGRSVRAVITDEIYSIVTNAIGVLEGISQKASRPYLALVENAERRLDDVERLYERAIRRRRSLYYLLGMLVALPLLPLLLRWITFQFIPPEDQSLVRITMLLATVGAFVSVMLRLSRSKLTFRNDAVWWEISLLGGLRVLLGLVFGFIIYVLVSADLIPLDIPIDENDRYWFFGAIGFLSGFSETLVPDQLVSASRIQVGDSGASGSGADE